MIQSVIVEFTLLLIRSIMYILLFSSHYDEFSNVVVIISFKKFRSSIKEYLYKVYVLYLTESASALSIIFSIPVLSQVTMNCKCSCIPVIMRFS